MRVRLLSVGVGALFLGGLGCLNLFFPFAPDQLFETQVRANCRFQFQCCTAAERSVQFLDEATCVEANFEQNASQALIGQRAQQAIQAGNAEHDAELAERCLRPFLDAANSCDPNVVFGVGERDLACVAGQSRFFTVGLVKDGDDCIDDLECADEGDCVVDNDEPEVISLAGKCRSRAGDGDDCDERECQTGLACIRDGEGTPTCQEVELKGKGDSCFDDEECDTGFCKPVAGGGRCFFDDEIGCSEDSDCDEDNGDFCDFDEDGGECDDAPDVEICDGQ